MGVSGQGGPSMSPHDADRRCTPDRCSILVTLRCNLQTLSNSDYVTELSTKLVQTFGYFLAADPPPPLPQKEPMVRYFLAYVSDDFKTGKKCKNFFFYKGLRSLHDTRQQIIS